MLSYPKAIAQTRERNYWSMDLRVLWVMERKPSCKKDLESLPLPLINECWKEAGY